MIVSHPDFVSHIEALVGELESSTDAEIVVVAARRSGSYRDVRLACAAGIDVAALLFLLYAPLSFHPASIPLYLLLLGLGAWWLAGRSPALTRALTRKGRREGQVIQAARAAFVEEAVHGTRGRTGVLVYLSELEQRLVLVRDLGLDGKAPGSAWNGLDLRASSLEELEGSLRAIGAVLAEHVPASEDNPNEIPNAPRVRS